MTAPEVRAGAEFRVAGRTLSGTVLRYGDTSPEHRERFLPGAFAPVPAVPLNVQHDRRMVVLDVGGFILNDTPRALEIRAELPADSAAIKLVRRGALNGYSVEFHARQERRESGVRVIERAGHRQNREAQGRAGASLADSLRQAAGLRMLDPRRRRRRVCSARAIQPGCGRRDVGRGQRRAG